MRGPARAQAGWILQDGTQCCERPWVHMQVRVGDHHPLGRGRCPTERGQPPVHSGAEAHIGFGPQDEHGARRILRHHGRQSPLDAPGRSVLDDHNGSGAITDEGAHTFGEKRAGVVVHDDACQLTGHGGTQ